MVPFFPSAVFVGLLAQASPADTVAVPCHQLLQAWQLFDVQLPAVQRAERRLLVGHPLGERDVSLLSRQHLPVVVDLAAESHAVRPHRNQGATPD